VFCAHCHILRWEQTLDRGRQLLAGELTPGNLRSLHCRAMPLAASKTRGWCFCDRRRGAQCRKRWSTGCLHAPNVRLINEYGRDGNSCRLCSVYGWTRSPRMQAPTHRATDLEYARLRAGLAHVSQCRWVSWLSCSSSERGVCSRVSEARRHDRPALRPRSVRGSWGGADSIEPLSGEIARLMAILEFLGRSTSK